MVRRAAALVLALLPALVATACSSGSADDDGTIAVAAPPSTVPGVGILPAPLPTAPTTTTPEPGSRPLEVADGDSPGATADGVGEGTDGTDGTAAGSAGSTIVVDPPLDDDGEPIEPIAAEVDGPRLIVVGDSILASVASRYGGELCDALVPLGWDVEVDAEPGRFVEFGRRVLEDRVADDVSDAQDPDAAVVHLGSNYGGDEERFFTEMNEILYRLAPRPTLVMTVSEYRPEWSEVNDAIGELADLYENVTVVDWSALATTPGLVGRDGLHPTDAGQVALVDQLALALGRVADTDGECLPSEYEDDSAADPVG